jgi:hypothetical protein
MAHFLPCPGCSRHVRASDAACPFCGAGLPLSLRSQKPVLPTKRLGRAATLAFGAALAAGSTAGCAEITTPSEDSGVNEMEDAGGVVALYGAASIDAGESEDAGQSVALYGAPAPEDAGPSVTPAYGAPAPFDAG